MHVQVVTCTVQFILSFSNISPSYELVHVGYLYDCWLASAMCPPATAGAAGWLPGIRNMIRIGLIPFCQINQPPQSPLGYSDSTGSRGLALPTAVAAHCC